MAYVLDGLEVNLENSNQIYIETVRENVAIPCKLTKREEEILIIMSIYGSSNQELSNMLYLSDSTVKNHIRNILKKTKKKSTRELLALVMSHAFKLIK
ncbi:DNA-binding NarL/FixJ family response regulator [Evansella vedderi]|uniref:DNA-binding NarL/FixJ family response regulator n=1 Tax=Evansella vedderi TaxID=38282 RepID=A0ABT9ZWG2_9BACI|nr:LuxR C-terminal-related transcriptional regulator [Evansella vedderi]MDQ0255553.1 DNA-binding NarL/FixJ family response regulator [Evansella vedderi]